MSYQTVNASPPGEGSRHCKAELEDECPRRLFLGSSSPRRPSRLHRVRKFLSARAVKPALFSCRRFGRRSSLSLGPSGPSGLPQVSRGVARDIGLRLRDPLLRELGALAALEPPPAKSEDNRRSSELIWFLIERASVSFVRDKVHGP